MKYMLFDTGPLITLSMNNLLWLLPELKERYNGKFLITQGVRKEAIDKPLSSKKFKFQALQILKKFSENVIELYHHPDLRSRTDRLLNLANNIFKAHDNYIKIVHYTEIEVLSAALILGADAIVVDEYVTRLLIEDPQRVKQRLENKLHVQVSVNENSLSELTDQVKAVKVIRSTELVTVAYEFGLLDDFLLSVPDSKKTLLDALLWGLKLNGASISAPEIDEILAFERVK